MSRDAEIQQDVQRYADGEMAGAELRGFEARLASEPDLAAAVAAVLAQNARIRAEIPEPSPERLARIMAGAKGARGFAPMRIAAVLALVALGAAGGFAAGQRLGPTGGQATVLLADSAAGAHALYAVEVRHPVEVTAQDRDHLAGWLSNRLGAEISAPDLTSHGYDLVGGRLLPFQGQGAAQFMYQGGSGDRVTLYAVTTDRPGQSAFRFQEKGKLTAVIWQEGIWRFALVGELPRPALEPLAHAIFDSRA